MGCEGGRGWYPCGKICKLITRAKSLFPRDIRGTLPTAYEQKKSIITVRIDSGHTPLIVLVSRMETIVKYPPTRTAEKFKGAAVGRDDGTVEGHYKGTAKGPNAIRRDNGTWKRCWSNEITGWWSNWRTVRWYSWNSGWCNSRRTRWWNSWRTVW